MREPSPAHDEAHRRAASTTSAAMLALLIGAPAHASGATDPCANALASVAGIQSAMKNAQPGAMLILAPGVYVGITSSSGDPGPRSCFYSGRSGTAASPIVLTSCDPSRPAVLAGGGIGDSSYVLHLTGDYWIVQDVVVAEDEKGIVIDNGNYNVLRAIEVRDIGDEGVHIRDGSSYNVLEHSIVHDTGKVRPGYGEGVYVGSDSSAAYDHSVIGNAIRYTSFAGNIAAEPIDIKEGADGTLVEYCTFDGTGISGVHFADSFIDVKGVNTTIRYNQGSRNGNVNVVDAFQVHTQPGAYPSGLNNRFNDNTVDLGDAPGYLVRASSSTVGTSARDDVRVGGGKLYSSYVNLPTAGLADGAAVPRLALEGFQPNPARTPQAISFVLPNPTAARLAITDVAGRRVFAEDVGHHGAGRHVLRSEAISRLAPGVYLISLEQSGERRTVRGVILR